MTPISMVSASPVADDIRALLPEIAARGDEIEDGTRVPHDLLDKLQTAGAFRLAVPTSLGGEGMSMAAIVEIIKDVAAADGSTAWHLMVGAGTQFIIARLPIASLKEFYSNGPDVFAKAAAAPKGIAVPVEGGYRLSGRWPLASGARDFDWVCLGFFIKDDNGLRQGPRGPDLRLGLVRRGDLKVIETWDAVGMRGTRSDDLEVKDMFIAEDWQTSFGAPSQLDEPAFIVGVPFATCPLHSAVANGILRAAIADLATSALTRKPAFAPTTLMKDDPIFRQRFGEIVAKADALDAMGDRSAAILDRCAAERRELTQIEGGQLLANESLIHHEGTQLMDQIMMLCGSGGVYKNNAQQRRWRDLRCAAQHVAANIGNYSIYADAIVAKAAAEASLA